MRYLADISSSCKAPEGWRTPRRFAYFKDHRVTHSVLDCGGPPPLFPTAYQTEPMLTGTAIGHYPPEESRQIPRSAEIFTGLTGRLVVLQSMYDRDADHSSAQIAGAGFPRQDPRRQNQSHRRSAPGGGGLCQNEPCGARCRRGAYPPFRRHLGWLLLR